MIFFPVVLDRDATLTPIQEGRIHEGHDACIEGGDTSSVSALTGDHRNGSSGWAR